MDPGTRIKMLLISLLMIKHFLADFPLQIQPMATGKGQDSDWLGWLSAHCAIHAVLSVWVFMIFIPIDRACSFATADYIAHFFIDRMKARYSRNVPVTDKSF